MSSEALDGVTITDEPIDADYAVRVIGASKRYGLWSSPNARLRHVALESVKGLMPRDGAMRRSIEAKIGAVYREFQALQPLSLDIRKGESWGFIGVNGSGKSTLLKMISGNLRPSTGRIEVNGRVAILDYSSGLHGDFTGRENIFLKASVFGMGRRETEAKLQSIIDFADIGAFIDQPVKTYSSGMVARLGFAIIAHTEADIIITDEALAVGDAFFVQKCMQHIRSFLKRGTFLFVSHSTNDVVSLCTKAVWLEHGQVREIGSARDVARSYLAQGMVAQSEAFERSETDRAEGQTGAGTTGASFKVAQPELARRLAHVPPRRIRDRRLELIDRTQWRNDIELPVLDNPDGGTGVGGARIVHVTLEDDDGNAFSSIVGGESVRLSIVVEAERDLASPIIGFQVFDHRGQVLFADNTYVATLDNAFRVASGESFCGVFRFEMPLLPVGDYALSAIVARGSATNAAFMHIVPTALVLRSTASMARYGLVGLPMQSIELFTLPDATAARTDPELAGSAE